MITSDLNTEISLKGIISIDNNINGKIDTDSDVKGDIIGGEDTHRSYYNNSYEITPKTENQELETREKIMQENIVINSIPYSQTPNDYGDTVYIGTEAE